MLHFSENRSTVHSLFCQTKFLSVKKVASQRAVLRMYTHGFHFRLQSAPRNRASCTTISSPAIRIIASGARIFKRMKRIIGSGTMWKKVKRYCIVKLCCQARAC